MRPRLHAVSRVLAWSALVLGAAAACACESLGGLVASQEQDAGPGAPDATSDAGGGGPDGAGDAGSIDAPPTESGASDRVQVECGQYHCCARKPNGSVWCWGWNLYGQLGNGSKLDSQVPVLVQGINDAVQVTTGYAHSCALRAGGAVSCWGNGASGQLGGGVIVGASPTPSPVTGLANAVQVGAGSQTTCAVRSDSTVSCWGYNADQQIAAADAGLYVLAPLPVPGLTDAVEVHSGESFTCARRKTGAVSCWGANDRGQIGSNTGDAGAPSPKAVVGLSDATGLALGNFHACASRQGGTAACWGYGGFGQIGNASYSDAYGAAAVSNLAGVAAIGAGGYGSCALLQTGYVACWGNGQDGELGNGTASGSSPVAVAVANLPNAVQIEVGGVHACAVVTDGGIACWGGNAYGELGTGNDAGASTPVRVTGF